MSTRIHHSPLPAPALHATSVSTQSKSHVLAGVQDAYWSDDEVDDAECPLCLEEMDISDLNFKPCPCGYQICRFCWHHIKQNLNGRCPACRREYSDEAVQFKPINKEDHKRLTQQKKQRERERKELDALNRKHLANVRVVQRNVVYVVGLGPRFAKEELIPTLRSNEYFGQYGKISKIVIVKRTPPGGRAPVIGLYITYNRKEDAARAISAVDGAPSPGGGSEIMRASYGTTKYCMAFLRGMPCTDHSCMNLHEWGDEKDCFTKEDLTTIKHTMKDTETRSRTTTVRKGDESEGLPRAASWASKAPLASSSVQNGFGSVVQSSSTGRTSRRGATTPSGRQQRTGSTATAAAESRGNRDRRTATSAAGKAPSVASSSRPATPAGLPNRPSTPATAKTAKMKEIVPQPPPPSRSPAPSSVAVESDTGSSIPESEAVPSPIPARAIAEVPAAPPGIPVVPPGLPPPPGLPLPKAQADALPLTPLPSQSSYQMSSQAMALMQDIRARRELPPTTNTQSPFPDFDRMLQTLSGGDSEFGGFSFNLDPTLAGDVAQDLTMDELEAEASAPFNGTFMEAFPALRSGAPTSNPLIPPPPGLGHPQYSQRPIYDPFSTRVPPPVERQTSASSSYTGSFNPFASEAADDTSSRKYSPFDDDRKVSRFGFAQRGRQGSSSSHHAPSPLVTGDSVSHSPFYNHSELSSPATRAPPGWPFAGRHDFSHTTPNSALSSPLAQHAQAATVYPPHQQSRFQPFDTGVSEAQLRDLINSSREHGGMRNVPSEQSLFNYGGGGQRFHDPAIMTARLASPATARGVPDFPSNTVALDGPPATGLFGPPPGLQYPDGHTSPPGLGSINGAYLDASQSGSLHVSASPSLAPSPALSSSDFPALSATVEPPRRDAPPAAEAVPDEPLVLDKDAQAKAERKAAKKVAAAERAAERTRIAQEKAAAKAVEKERVAQEKAAEKEKAAALKVEKERAAKEKAEKDKEDRLEQERLEKERLEREKAERAERERVEKERAEKERVVREGKEKAKNVAKKVVEAEVTEKAAKKGTTAKASPLPVSASETVVQAPIMSRMPKKNKPAAKPIKIPKEDPIADPGSGLTSAATSDAPQLPDARTRESSSNNSRAGSVDRTFASQPKPLETLLTELDVQLPWMELEKHPFFDLSKVNPASKMPLEYGPLVHALSALSVGGGAFANNMPSGSIDNAVSSFQQLLETLTQTISDLLRLLPRKTWDDNSSFDGVLRDMLKGDDFLDDGGDDQNGQAKEDEVAALTLALERRARWMEVQLSKLEELHRDINTAAVRAVLAFNDNGWDVHGFLPRVSNTLQRFDQLGVINDKGTSRMMTADELEKKLAVAKEAAAFAEVELRETMQRMQLLRPVQSDEY